MVKNSSLLKNVFEGLLTILFFAFVMFFLWALFLLAEPVEAEGRVQSFRKGPRGVVLAGQVRLVRGSVRGPDVEGLFPNPVRNARYLYEVKTTGGRWNGHSCTIKGPRTFCKANFQFSPDERFRFTWRYNRTSGALSESVYYQFRKSFVRATWRGRVFPTSEDGTAFVWDLGQDELGF